MRDIILWERSGSENWEKRIKKKKRVYLGEGSVLSFRPLQYF